MGDHINSRIQYLIIAIILILILLSTNSFYITGIINLFSLIFFSFGIVKIQGKLLSPFLLIGVSLYIFNSGHLWVSLFNPEPENFLLSFEWYLTSSLTKITQIYSFITILLIIYMATGLLFTKSIQQQYYNLQAIEPTKSFYYLFLILYFILMIFDIFRARSVSNLGYGDGYRYTEDWVMYLSSSVDLFLLLFLYLYRKNRNKFKTILILLLLKVFFIMFFVGNRGSSVINLLVTLFIVSQYSYLSKNKKLMRKIILVSILFLLVSLPFISIIRQKSSNENFNEFVQEENPIEMFFTEFGGTAINVFLVDQYLQTKEASNGLQIAATSMAFIPGSTTLFGDIIGKYISIGAQLNNFFDREYLGGSMIGQLYFNFGNTIYIYISMIIIGIISSFISNKLLEKQTSIYYTFIYFCIFTGLMTFVRGEWYDVVSRLKIGLYLCLIMYMFKDRLFNLKFYDTKLSKIH